MRNLIVALVFVVVSATAAAAQLVYPSLNYGYPPNQAVMSLDFPRQGATLLQSDIYFAGWAFNCNGEFIHDYNLWVYVPGGPNGGDFVRWPSVVTGGIYRPDVSKHYADMQSPCVVSDHSGWHLYPIYPLPVGAVAYVVQAYVSGGYFREGTGELMVPSAVVRTRYLISFVR